MLPGRARTKKINQFRKHESLKTRKRDKINFVLSKLRTFVLEKVFYKMQRYAFMRSTDLIDVLSQLKCNGSIET